MHLHVNPLTFHLQEIMLNLPILFYVLCFFWFLIWSVNRSVFNSIYGICWTFGGTVFILLFTLILQIFFYKDLNLSAKEQVGGTANIEKTAPNMLKDKTLFIPFIAFILLHIGQWMYTMNMPLFVTDYLKEQEGYVGTLASLCAGLEVPFMVILGMLSAKLATRTLLIIGAISGGAFYFSIGVFENIYAMMIGQIFLALFLAILLGLGISYFQDILPDFPGYASTLFANAMVIGQLLGNLLGGAMSHWVGLENVFFVSATSIFIGMILIFFTKDQNIRKRM